MRVDILYFDGCPNHLPTTEMIRDVARSLGIGVVIREVEVRDAEEAARLKFFGSPTVQVDGEDVEPAAQCLVDYSFSCRMYGLSGPPLRELVEAALRKSSRP